MKPGRARVTHGQPARQPAGPLRRPRAAARRALTTFKPLFAAEIVRPLRGELKWLAGELGAARDAEVMRDRVSDAVQAEKHTVALGPVAGIADAELGEAYRGAQDRVLAELDGERYHRLLGSLDELVNSPPFTERAAAAAGKTRCTGCSAGRRPFC